MEWCHRIGKKAVNEGFEFNIYRKDRKSLSRSKAHQLSLAARTNDGPQSTAMAPARLDETNETVCYRRRCAYIGIRELYRHRPKEVSSR